MRLAIERIDILLLSLPVFLETPITILFHTDSQSSTQCQPTPTFTSIKEIPPSMHLERKNRGLRIDSPHSPNPAFTPPCGLLPWKYLATHFIDSRPETSARKPISHFSPNSINYEHHRHRRRHLLPLPLHHTTGPPLLNPTNLAPKNARRMLHHIHHNILRQKPRESVRNDLKAELRE